MRAFVGGPTARTKMIIPYEMIIPHEMIILPSPCHKILSALEPARRKITAQSWPQPAFIDPDRKDVLASSTRRGGELA